MNPKIRPVVFFCVTLALWVIPSYVLSGYMIGDIWFYGFGIVPCTFLQVCMFLRPVEKWVRYIPAIGIMSFVAIEVVVLAIRGRLNISELLTASLFLITPLAGFIIGWTIYLLVLRYETDFEFLDVSDLKTGEISLKLRKQVPGNLKGDRLPDYRFYILDSRGNRVGECDLRVGHNEKVFYGGNIGYRVYENFRGNHYAAKAVTLLKILAKRHGMEFLYISCSPENKASYRTCEIAGGKLLGTFTLPADNDMRLRDGEEEKCVFKFTV